MRFFNFRRTVLGVQCSCYGLGYIGFLVSPRDINNKFNRASSILKVGKYEYEEPCVANIVLGDYVDLNTLFDYIRRFKFSTPVNISFYGAKRGRKERPFLMGAKLC